MEFNEVLVLIVACVLIFASIFFGWEIRLRKNRHIKLIIFKIARKYPVLTTLEFFYLRNELLRNRYSPYIINQYNFTGVYIIYNKNKKMYYVGQAQKILDRVNNHFTGKGNGDVYADYKYGDQFSIQMLRYDKTMFKTLNEFERCAILAYGAFKNGYNKTRGNY